MDRRNQTDTAAARLLECHNVLWLRDFVNCNPLRVHATQQHEHPIAFRTAGEHVCTRTKIKLRHTMHRSRQFLPFIHNGHALPCI